MAMLNKNEVNLCLGTLAIKKRKVGVAFSEGFHYGEIMPVSAVIISIAGLAHQQRHVLHIQNRYYSFCSTNMAVEVICDNNSVCLLTDFSLSKAQNSLLALSEQPVCGPRAESSDSDLHEAVNKTFHAFNHVLETFEDGYTNSAGSSGLAHRMALNA